MDDLQVKYGASQTQARAVMMISRSVYHYRARRRDQMLLVNRIKEIAAARVRYGYQRVHILLRREGWLVNRKRVYRLYRLKGYRCFSDALDVIVRRCSVTGRQEHKQGTNAGAWTSSVTSYATDANCAR